MHKKNKAKIVLKIELYYIIGFEYLFSFFESSHLLAHQLIVD